jgi:predicted metalloprotease with PDZ domain
VRAAYLDATRGYFNGPAVFLCPEGRAEAPCEVEIASPEGAVGGAWRVATTLPSAGAPRCGFGRYRAENYDELIDHPVEMGTFTLATFTACGVPHEIAITGRHDCDLERLTADLKKICEWQIRFFGEPAPMKKYVFLVTAVGDGYGGLEHRASTALLCSRDDLPYAGMKGLPERYRTFLGLCSHEYFHTWNVKRIKPAAFTPYDLDRENYTTLLWAFEGFTSYYDDLALLRSGVIAEKDWLELTAKNLDNVLRGPGRLMQSLADSSFDAWSKYYRPDENTPNAVVSYYAKGALVALALDLTLRTGTTGRISLDDVMRALWQRHGKTGVGVDEDGIRKIAEELSGLKLKRFFDAAILGTQDLPLEKLLKPFGIVLTTEAPGEMTSKTPSLGAKTSSEGNEVRLATVYSAGAAQQAGLSAGDVLVAIDGLRVTPTTLDRQLMRRRAGDTITVHAFRRDELLTVELCLAPPVPGSSCLTAKGGNKLGKAFLETTPQSKAKTRRVG